MYPWPDVEFLFGEDESYQLVISEIMRTVTKSLSKLSNYGETYKPYCEMIESILQLKIERSIKRESFSPSDYHFLLQKHNEYVKLILFSMKLYFLFNMFLQIQAMETMVVSQRIAIFLFSASGFQFDCLPYPKQVIKVIDSHMPIMAIERNEKIQETMRVCFFYKKIL